MFARWWLWQLCLISDQNYSSYYSVQEKKEKIDFQNCGQGGYFWISDRNDCIFHWFAVALILLTKSVDLSVQEKKLKIDFQDGGHYGYFGFSIKTIISIFVLQIAPKIPTKFQVHWPFGGVEEAQTVCFSRWRPSRLSWNFQSERFN